MEGKLAGRALVSANVRERAAARQRACRQRGSDAVRDDAFIAYAKTLPSERAERMLSALVEQARPRRPSSAVAASTRRERDRQLDQITGDDLIAHLRDRFRRRPTEWAELYDTMGPIVPPWNVTMLQQQLAAAEARATQLAADVQAALAAAKEHRLTLASAIALKAGLLLSKADYEMLAAVLQKSGVVLPPHGQLKPVMAASVPELVDRFDTERKVSFVEASLFDSVYLAIASDPALKETTHKVLSLIVVRWFRSDGWDVACLGRAPLSFVKFSFWF